MTDRDDVVDARGLRCPLPVIRLAERARGAAPGTELEVWATDPAAAADVPAWCRMRGHAFLGAKGAGEHTAYRVRVGGPPRPGDAPPRRPDARPRPADAQSP